MDIVVGHSIIFEQKIYKYGEAIPVTSPTIKFSPDSNIKLFCEFYKDFFESVAVVLYTTFQSEYLLDLPLKFVELRVWDVGLVGLLSRLTTCLVIDGLIDEIEFALAMMMGCKIPVKKLVCDRWIPYIYTFLFPRLEELETTEMVLINRSNRSIHLEYACMAILKCDRKDPLINYVYERIIKVPDNPTLKSILIVK